MKQNSTSFNGLFKVYRYLLIFIFLFILRSSFGQKEKIVELYNDIQKYTPFYLRQAERISNKTFIKYSTLVEISNKRPEMDKFDFFWVPMLELHLKGKELNNEVCILNYVKARRRVSLSTIIILQDESYYATCSCTEYLPYSIYRNVSNSDSTSTPIYQMERVKSLKNYSIFYIRGFLHTWWLVNKEGSVQVYSILDDKFYELNEYMNKYFPPEKINAIIERYY